MNTEIQPASKPNILLEVASLASMTHGACMKTNASSPHSPVPVTNDWVAFDKAQPSRLTLQDL